MNDKLNRVLEWLCATVYVALFLVIMGCAHSGGKQEALRRVELGTNGTVQITSEAGTVLLSNVTSYVETDWSKVAASGLLTIQGVEKFTHERNGFLGNKSKSGVQTYTSDPDEKAIESSGTAVGSVAEKVVKGVKGTP